MKAMKEAELANFELYDLRTDPGETRDRSGDEPGRLAELKEAMRAIYLDVREETPVWPDWTAPPKKGGGAAPAIVPAGTPTERLGSIRDR